MVNIKICNLIKLEVFWSFHHNIIKREPLIQFSSLVLAELRKRELEIRRASTTSKKMKGFS